MHAGAGMHLHAGIHRPAAPPHTPVPHARCVCVGGWRSAGSHLLLRTAEMISGSPKARAPLLTMRATSSTWMTPAATSSAALARTPRLRCRRSGPAAWDQTLLGRAEIGDGHGCALFGVQLLPGSLCLVARGSMASP